HHRLVRREILKNSSQSAPLKYVEDDNRRVRASKTFLLSTAYCLLTTTFDMPRNENRMQLALALLVGLLLLANLFTLTLVALSPATRAERAPVLYTVFVLTLVISVPSILLLPRWLLRPYRQLVDEA